ncbi:MAG TPA: hypothetical protein VJU61_25335, partial [Polyangiaceae bacterium]|nr:hypothetical protein [Polyangiaceae bacterium]
MQDRRAGYSRVWGCALPLLALLCACSSTSRIESVDTLPRDAGTEPPSTTPVDAPAANVGPCGEHAEFGPRLKFNILGDLPAAYEGPAVVERSTTGNLRLAFQPSLTPDAGATGSSLPAHLGISGLSPMPLFPLGARLWLSQNSLRTPSTEPSAPSSFWLRDREGGRLLFGAAWGSSSELGAPVALDHRTRVCDEPLSKVCAEPRVFYSELDVHGDTTLRIGDSETANLSIGGFEYEVRVTAREEPDAPHRYCGVYAKNEGVSLELQAKDLQQLIAQLEVGELPACVESNGEYGGTVIQVDSLYGQSSYEGRAVYQYRADTPWQECLHFGEVDAPLTTSGSPPSLDICSSERSLPQPSSEQEWWVVRPRAGLVAVREAQGGALLYANALVSASADAADAALVEATLGLAVRA